MLLVVATACWTQETRIRADHAVPALAEGHMVWTCSANAGEFFDTTQHLVQRATQDRHTLACFWLREEVLRAWTQRTVKPRTYGKLGQAL